MQNRLLTLGTLVVAGTLNGSLLGGATSFVVGVASNIFAADLQTLWDRAAQRLQGREAVLQNEDLCKAVGTAIAAVIAQFAQENRIFVPEDFQPLNKLANHAAQEWQYLINAPDFVEEAEFDAVREPFLAQMFSHQPSEFDQVRALTPEAWEQVLLAWQSGEPKLTLDPQTTRKVSQQLYCQFPKALREVLKEDFATGGRAFGALALDLIGDLGVTLQQQHETMLARIDGLSAADRDQVGQEYEQVLARLDALAAGNPQAFQELAGQIESGFGNVAQLLAELGIQLEAAKEEILEHQKTGFQRIEDKLDGLLRPPLEVSVAIGSFRSEVKFWKGRETDLETLRQQIEQVSLVGISGLGGYGKSALANRIFEMVDWPIKVWVTMSKPYSFGELGRWLLGKLGCQIDEQADDDALATVLANCLTEHRGLVVLDNLETLLDSDGEWLLPGYKGFLLKWLEYGRNSAILVTSREQPRLPTRNTYWHPPLTGLTADQGAALLRGYGVTGEETAVQEFVVLADGHPLLLELAATLLKDEFGENPNILGLRTARLNLFDWLGLHRGDPEASVNKLFTASFERLEERLQRLLCCVSVYRLPFDASAAAVMLKETALTWQEPTTQRQIEQDLRGLVRRSLLQESKSTALAERKFQFLPLIEGYVRQQQNNWTWAHERAIFFYRATAKPTNLQSDEDLQEYFQAFHHHFELKQFVLANDVLDRCNGFLSLRGYNRKLIELYGRLIREWQPTHQQEQSNFGRALNRLGNATNVLGKYQQAINYYKQSLQISREIGDHNGEASSLNNLGNAAYSLGQYQQAINYHKQSLKIQHKTGDRKGKASSLNNLGNAAYSLDQHQQAFTYYKQSLQISREIGDRMDEAASLNNLGNAAHALCQYEQAINYYEQSLQISQEIGDRGCEASSLGNLGNVANTSGQYSQAIIYFKQSLQITRETGNRKGEAASINNLGETINASGRYKQAITYYEKSLQIQREIGDRRGEAASLINLGNISNVLSQYSQAIIYLKQSLQIMRETGNRKGEAASLNNLGNATHNLGQYPQAIIYFEQSLQIQREIGNLSDEASSLSNLGNAASALGQYQRALNYHKQSLQIQRKIDDRMGEAASLNNLGNVANTLGQYQQAINYYKQSLQVSREIGNRSCEAASLNNLGNVNNAMGQHPQAISFLEQSLQIELEIGDRKGEAASLNNLGDAASALGQYQKAISHHEKSLQIQREIGDLNGEANSLIGLGNVANSLGQYPQAITYYDQSIQIKREIGDRKGEASSLNNLASIYGKTGKLREAFATAQQAKAIELEIGVPLYPAWLNDLIKFAQKSWFHLSLCFIFGLFAFPFAIVGFLAILGWRWIMATLRH